MKCFIQGSELIVEKLAFSTIIWLITQTLAQ